MQGIDLHTHSNISDGTLSPEQLLDAAANAQLSMIALTDHDSMQGIARAQHAAQQHNIQLISGVEISAQWTRTSTAKSFGVHILALDTQQPEPLQRLLATQQQCRAERAQKIINKLQAITGKDITPLVLAQVHGQLDHVTRTHIAKALVELKIVSRSQQAFDRFLKEGRPAFVRFDGPNVHDCVATIHAAQGFAVLAHPTRYNLSATHVRCLIDLFAQAGGDAIELPPSNEAPATRQMVDRLIEQHGLAVSIGSDFHGENMPWVKLGHTPKPLPSQLGIWTKFKQVAH